MVLANLTRRRDQARPRVPVVSLWLDGIAVARRRGGFRHAALCRCIRPTERHCSNAPVSVPPVRDRRSLALILDGEHLRACRHMARRRDDPCRGVTQRDRPAFRADGVSRVGTPPAAAGRTLQRGLPIGGSHDDLRRSRFTTQRRPDRDRRAWRCKLMCADSTRRRSRW